jgi:hypothetical protein
MAGSAFSATLGCAVKLFVLPTLFEHPSDGTIECRVRPRRTRRGSASISSTHFPRILNHVSGNTHIVRPALSVKAGDSPPESRAEQHFAQHLALHIAQHHAHNRASIHLCEGVVAAAQDDGWP